MRGKLPFPKWINNATVQVLRTELSEDGESVETLIYSGPCNYDEKSKQVLDKERRLIRLAGRVIIEGDIAPGQQIEGLVRVAGVERSIFRTERPRNPDGSIFSTELELM
ncbi:hypothetical protein [Paenibacillus alvei]|uniref:hypothetical protein n=1 Tax=Paenibacillus alvei TaxID=44250 RepID=UPI0018CE9935|nr:hypothetical protein [Paenibacillus alvei]MBG9737094.1 hypothetical protein [Paenibacillus alvei]MBG9742796.1 hypothetical protein [Paenibacillus alvei]MBG9746187.1 hypothetical protein [Paenibacillus alvei]MCY9579705.1 hypothetical protein [Paenibacillus alvei]MCY9586358.1 hypothetical protein [Paenibacillus alvei]